MTNRAKINIPITAHAHYAVTLWSHIINETNQNLVSSGILECNHFISYRIFISAELALAKSGMMVRVL